MLSKRLKAVFSNLSGNNNDHEGLWSVIVGHGVKGKQVALIPVAGVDQSNLPNLMENV